jgi:hypothetical protein
MRLIHRIAARRRQAAAIAAAFVLTAVTAGVPAPASAQATLPGETTVDAPNAGPDATITVSRTKNLVNQTVAVSWSGFRPSSATRLDNSGDALDINTKAPVRVYQCRGESMTAPASSSDCYGSPGFRGAPASGTQPAVDPVPSYTYPGQQDAFDPLPDGPPNWQDAVTGADGSGQVAIQLFTVRESVSLGCDGTNPCSLVVVPNYGRPDGDTEDLMDAPWAWDRRTVVPLKFLPVGDACPISGTSVGVEGSPMVARALASWRAKTCTLSNASVRLDYTSIGEPQTRGDLASGTTNVGLTIDPVDPVAAAKRGLVYAPLAVTGLVVAFQIDDANGKQVRSLKLNARLVTKLITGSYRSGGDAAVIKNPVNIFHDPEFLKLNPGVDWPSGAPGNHPLLLGDLSDTTIALTRWIASDKEARGFLTGQADPWGMTVNQKYKNLKLPIASFPLLDQLQSDSFQPVQEMDALARQLSIAQFPGGITTVENGVNVVTKPPRQNPGRREVIGIIDAASAASFRLPTASLRNAGGAFVQPTNAAMVAGVLHAKVHTDGVTRIVDTADKNKSIYPLSVLVSAGLSTKADKAERQGMANMLDYVGGPGQVTGDEFGNLPEGYAPLPAKLAALSRTAKTEVLKGYHAARTTTPTPTPTPTSSPTDDSGSTGDGSTSGDGAGGGATTPAQAAPSATATPEPSADLPYRVGLVAQQQVVGSVPAGARLIAVPVILGAGLLTLILGPGVLLLGRTKRGPRWLRR